jgi:amino acid transporter
MSRRDEDREPGHKKAEVDVVGMPRAPSSAVLWALFLAGPVIWIFHFMVVYLIAEAVCQAGGTGREVWGLPLVSFVTVVATAVAVAAILAVTVLAYRRWRAQERRAREDPAEGAREHRDPRRDRTLMLSGVLLGLLFALSVIYVGLPALWLRPC